MKLNKSCVWGALPWESDGGAVVAFYLYNILRSLEPKHEFYGIPKVPPMLDKNALPFMNFMIPEYNRGLLKENQHLLQDIPNFMLQNDIPLLTFWHVPWEFFPIAKRISEMGGKTICHQTVHWKTDVLFKSDCLQDIDGWVAPTRWAAEQLNTVGKIPKNKIKYIPHAVDLGKFYPHETEFRKSLKLSPKQKVILFVGRASLAKGLHNLIPVMRPLINDYNCIFIIKAGVHPNVAKSKEIGFILNIMRTKNPNIRWIPSWHPPEYMEELMASCDILVQPSGHEGFDVPLIEAMACRKPIAVTNIPNHYEIMSGNHHCGLLMEPMEVAELVNDEKQEIKIPSSDMIEGTLRFMLENPEECDAMGEEGYKRVKKNYDLKKIGRMWIRYMDSLFPEIQNQWAFTEKIEKLSEKLY